MANAFGYMPPGQAGTPDPRMVGQMLMQPRQPEGQQAQAMPMPVMDDPGNHHEFPAHTPEEQMRRDGAKLMGGGGADALSAAVGEALTRAGGGHRGNQNPHKQRAHHIAQLQHLGLSEVEAMLLGETL
jgi:hypothetical protein